jgi:hypothetical protein
MHLSARGYWLLAILLTVASGCGDPPLFQATTIVRPDGSCERTIIQPRVGYLPTAARPVGDLPDSNVLSDEWIAQWTSVAGAERPPKSAAHGAALGTHPYFQARGTFDSPSDIPLHYLYLNKSQCTAGISKLAREFEQTDFGLFVEYRWRETLTNSVSREQFVGGIKSTLDLLEPLMECGVPKALGDTYDVKALVNFLKTDGRAAFREMADIYYDTRLCRADDEAIIGRMVDVLRQHGMPWPNTQQDPIGQLVADVLRTSLRRHDGVPITADEVQQIMEALDKFDWKAQQAALGIDEKQFETIFEACGVYPPFYLFHRAETFEYSLELPGTLLDTNGLLMASNRTFWRFTADASFPRGYEMIARSIGYRPDIQKGLLGRIVIEDGRAAEEFVKLVERSGPLFDAVEAACRQGTLDPIRALRGGKTVNSDRVKKLQELLQ